MSRPRDTHREVRQQFDQFGFRHDFELDSRRREQQIDDWSFGFIRTRESHSGQASDRILFNNSFYVVTVCAKLADQCFRF